MPISPRTPLTEEQRDLISKNIPLSQWVAKRYWWLPRRFHGEALDIAVDGLINAAIKYVPGSKYAFSTRVVLECRKRLHAWSKKLERHHKRHQYVKFLAGLTRCELSQTKKVEIDDLIDYCRRLVPERFWFAIWERLALDRNLDDVGRDLGVTKQRVGEMVKVGCLKITRHFRTRQPPSHTF